MDDRELVELIRRGAASWRGQSVHASTARFARSRFAPRWRFAAVSTAAAAAAILLALSLTGGPGPVVHAWMSATTKQSEVSPQAEPTQAQTTPTQEQRPKTDAPSAPKTSEPAPPVRHEPVPSPEPSHPTPPSENPPPKK